MDFLCVVRRRRMVRAFTAEPVDPAVVDRILDTARRGPSAGFSQAVDFVIVTDEKVRAAIAEPAARCSNRPDIRILSCDRRSTSSSV